MKNKLQRLVENAIIHKEVIEPNLKSAISNKNHYNAKNSIYPEPIGRGNFIDEACDAQFKKVLNKMKRVHSVSDINPQEFFKIKRDIQKILKDIKHIESSLQKQLNPLAETIIGNYYKVPKSIYFEFDTDEDDFTSEIGKDILSSFKNSAENVKFDDYDGVENANKDIDRQRLNYCLICGGANDTMSLFKGYEDGLDEIHYKLYDLYNKFCTFNNFNLWVTPDNILDEDSNATKGFKIYETEYGYRISIEAQTFLGKLYEMSKAVLSILFQEKYNNSNVDYENPWNSRIGSFSWSNFIGCLDSKDHNLPHIIDSINQLNTNDYSYVMREILMETAHAKRMFFELSQQ